MENGSRSSRQNLTIEDGGNAERKTGGFYVSTPTLLFGVALFVAAVIAVGLVVYFAVPEEQCRLITMEERKQACKDVAKQVGTAGLCGPEDKPSDKKDLTDQDSSPKKNEKVTGLRLNKTLIPSHYDLELWPRIYPGDDFGFNGSVTIWMACREQTNVIVLHVDMVDVHENTIELRDANQRLISINRTEEDEARQFYKIYPQEKLTQNHNYSIFMSFNGTTVHDDYHGFYRSNYMENGVEHWIVSTQFETTAARRAFPVFDENYFRSTFTVTMVRRQDYKSQSNMPLSTTISRGGQWQADVFQKSVNMVPYLLAFSVNQFVALTNRTKYGVTTRVYTPPSMQPFAEYANRITPSILEAFEDWTGIRYPLPKLDQILIPDFYFGAMENWGLIKYRDSALLYNPQYSDITQKNRVAYVIAHELAHQWFGNLVTCRWWDDIFLNEAFATYFGYFVGLKGAEPNWEVEEYFMRVFHNVMEYDGRHDSKPIRLPDLEHHDGLMEAFSTTAYRKYRYIPPNAKCQSRRGIGKGGSVLRMIRGFLGAETFQKGLQKYLNRHQYQTVVNEDLYRAWQEQAEEDNSVTWDSEKANLSSIISSWVDQQNFPLVQVTDQGDGSLLVTQSHFLQDPELKPNVSFPTPLGSEFLWDIPLTYTDSTMTEQTSWILREKESMVGGLDVNGWKMVNVDLMGFYRALYGVENWNRILLQLMNDHTVFSVNNRAGFLDDVFYTAKSGAFEEVDALRGTQYLKNERSYLPWYAGTQTRLPYYLDMFFGKPVYDQLEKYFADLVVPFYDYTGWTVESDPNVFIKRYARQVALDVACRMNYKPCVDTAQAMFEQYIGNPNVNPIHPDLRSTVYCTSIARGGIREWEFLKSRYEFDYGDIYLGYENRTLRDALACPTTPNIIRKYLDYALEKNSTTLFTAIAKKREARDTVWNYILERWDDFMDGNNTRSEFYFQDNTSRCTDSGHIYMEYTRRTTQDGQWVLPECALTCYPATFKCVLIKNILSEDNHMVIACVIPVVTVNVFTIGRYFAYGDLDLVAFLSASHL